MALTTDTWGQRKAMIECLIDMLENDVYIAAAIKEDFETIDENVSERLLEYVNVITRYSDLFQSYWDILYNENEYSFAYQSAHAPAVTTPSPSEMDDEETQFSEVDEDTEWDEDLPEPDDGDDDEDMWELRQFVKGVSINHHDRRLGGIFDGLKNAVKGVFKDAKKTISSGNFIGNAINTVAQMVPEGTKDFKGIVNSIKDGCVKEGKSLLMQGAGKGLEIVKEKVLAPIEEKMKSNPITSKIWDVGNALFDASGIGTTIKKKLGLEEPTPVHYARVDADKAIIGDTKYEGWTTVQGAYMDTNAINTSAWYDYNKNLGLPTEHLEHLKYLPLGGSLRSETEIGISIKTYVDLSPNNDAGPDIIALTFEASSDEYKDLYLNSTEMTRLSIASIGRQFARKAIDLRGYRVPVLCKYVVSQDDEEGTVWSDWGFWSDLTFGMDHNGYVSTTPNNWVPCVYLRNPYWLDQANAGMHPSGTMIKGGGPVRIMLGRTYVLEVGTGTIYKQDAAPGNANDVKYFDWTLRVKGEYRRTNTAEYNTFYILDFSSMKEQSPTNDNPDRTTLITPGNICINKNDSNETIFKSCYCMATADNTGEADILGPFDGPDNYVKYQSSVTFYGTDASEYFVRNTGCLFYWMEHGVPAVIPDLNFADEDNIDTNSFCFVGGKIVEQRLSTSTTSQYPPNSNRKMSFCVLDATTEVFRIQNRGCVEAFFIKTYAEYINYNIKFKQGNDEECWEEQGDSPIVALGEMPKEFLPADDIVVPITTKSWILISYTGEVTFTTYETEGPGFPAALGTGMTYCVTYPTFRPRTAGASATLPTSRGMALPAVTSKYKRIPSLKHRLKRLAVDYLVYDWTGIMLTDFTVDYDDGIVLMAPYDLKNLRRPIYYLGDRVDTREKMADLIDNVKTVMIKIGDGTIMKPYSIKEVKQENLTGTIYSGYYIFYGRVVDFMWAWDNLQWVYMNAVEMTNDLLDITEGWDNLSVLDYFENIKMHREKILTAINTLTQLFVRIKQETLGE